MNVDEFYMYRCLQLARNGMQNAKPNPMVGAVIVADGRIIGEGYHVRCGEGHAEVNAFASVRKTDEYMLSDATIYVSLEPCSHYGKTPPCADLIIKKGVKRVVVGCMDPFAKVHGRGIQKLREAGVEVVVGVLEEECKNLNKRFMTFNTLHRPYVVLKWCQTANGFLDDDFRPIMLSTPFTQMLVHKMRAEHDAIIVGRITEERDKPRLTVRSWSGNNPEKIVICKSSPSLGKCDFHGNVPQQIVEGLYAENKQSVIVEGGAKTIRSFIEAGIWDEIRIETSQIAVKCGTKAPMLPDDTKMLRRESYDGNIIEYFERIHY